MIINERINCLDFPCTDIEKNSYVLPFREIDAENTRILMITEAPPNDKTDKRVLPSYTPAGKNFLIEKSKRRMVAEDIREARKLIH